MNGALYVGDVVKVANKQNRTFLGVQQVGRVCNVECTVVAAVEGQHDRVLVRVTGARVAVEQGAVNIGEAQPVQHGLRPGRQHRLQSVILLLIQQ